MWSDETYRDGKLLERVEVDRRDGRVMVRRYDGRGELVEERPSLPQEESALAAHEAAERLEATRGELAALYPRLADLWRRRDSLAPKEREEMLLTAIRTAVLLIESST